jgi:hypothetical protein
MHLEIRREYPESWPTASLGCFQEGMSRVNVAHQERGKGPYVVETE